ncbi:hypothetical protein Aple_059260 [Acrocarpospora pleiomorpha]|uniref:Uncharacterized protein n=1 Tax=Acrocarpospora pleiomorpha TaxID=90975 RepID=A0A5M3XNW1_9ACTN|nr:hypothetical protein [Acrocarpospora pleiomorpha]GES23027.1 hypothetical protein Aple_059260 [Acrocarpospora pleiomorpha]
MVATVVAWVKIVWRHWRGGEAEGAHGGDGVAAAVDADSQGVGVDAQGEEGQEGAEGQWQDQDVADLGVLER